MRVLRPLALVLAALLVAAPAVAAKPPPAGSLDRSFGDNGRVTFKLPGERMTPTDLVVQPDGRIVVVGTLVEPGQYSYGGQGFAVRFESEGEIDTSFGEAGIARVASSKPLSIQGAGLQPDGALLLSGTTPSEDGDTLGAIVRLLPSGRVDQGFGSAGIATLPDAGFTSSSLGVWTLNHIAVMPDSRIVAAGRQYPYDVHSRSDPYVGRLMPDGTPDPSFDVDGRASMGTSNPIAVLVRPNGEVVVVGWDDRLFGGTDLSLLRLDPGRNDFPYPSVASDASVHHTYRNSLEARAADLRPDGTIAVVGELANYRNHDDPRIWLARARIGPDLHLLERGKVRTNGVTAAAFDSRGAVLSAGPWLAEATPPPWRLQRYREMRRLDRSFGNRKGSRLLHIDPPSGLTDTLDTELTGMTVAGDKLIVAGVTHVRNDPREGRSLTLTRLNARQDGARPRLTVKGLPHHRCVSRTTDLLVLTRDESRVTTHLRIDRRRLATNSRRRFHVELDTSDLKPGRHRLRIRSVDAAGNLGARSWMLRVCG